ncbi:MAG: hypothetical protein QXS20_00180 [Candidatus Thorarchaeota archaeon]
MSEMEEGWKRVLQAFDDWVFYESSEYGPWTAYFSAENLRDLTSSERLGWMYKMRDEVIPGRLDKCRQAGIALEDFVPLMPDPESAEIVQSMIDLNDTIARQIMALSDLIDDLIHEYQESGMDDVAISLSALADTEEDIRHHMSLFSDGFARLRSMGLEVPEDIG